MEYNIRDKYIVKQPVAGPSFADDDDEAPDGAMNDDNRESSTATKSGKPKSVDSPTPTIDKYAIEFARKHDSIPAVEDFHLSDADFDDFVEFAKTREFDYRSSAKASFDQMKNEMEKDGLADTVKEQLDVIEKALQIEKEQFMRLKKDEIVPFIEEEIAVRYYYQKAGVQVRLRYDNEVSEVLKYIHNQPQE